MSIDIPAHTDALEQLKTQYRIVEDPIDLSIFDLPDGRQKIFDMLSKAYRPCFESDQRIIVTQPDHSMYHFSDDLASTALIFLQQALQKIDISNFFVIVISSNPDINNELIWVQKNHSTDDHPIGSYGVAGNFEKKEITQDTFCPLPWMHLHVNTNLEMSPCCFSDSLLTWGSLLEEKPETIANSTEANRLRLNMLEGKKSKSCQQCYVAESNGYQSHRQYQKEKYSDLIPDLIKKTRADGSLTSYSPIRMDARLNNICNLKCRTCDGQFSIKLAQEEARLFDNKINLVRIKTLDQRQQAFEKILEAIDHTQEFYFAGGEPLIMFEHYTILDRLIEQKRFETKISYNTNFTTLTYQDRNVLDYWKKFQNIQISASIDGHHEIFEYVRHGARWSDIEKNLALLKKECPHVDFYIDSTISVYSAESIMELQKLWHENQILDIDKFNMHLVSADDNFSLQTLFRHHKTYLSDKIDQHCQWLQDHGADRLNKEWQGVKSMMWMNDQSYKSPLIAHVNQARDQARNENFQDLYPQFRDLFKTTVKS